jgi:peptide/nickel transport system substrate-binding protein
MSAARSPIRLMLLIVLLLVACGPVMPRPSSDAMADRGAVAPGADEPPVPSELPRLATPTAFPTITPRPTVISSSVIPPADHLRVGLPALPATLFRPESHAWIEAQLLSPLGKCWTSLGFDYQPTYCFESVPSIENGDLVSATVAIDPTAISPSAPIFVEGQLVTDTAVAETQGIAIPAALPQLRATWRLNPNLRWEDGTPVTASDALESFRVLSEVETLPFDWSRARLASVEALDDHTVAQTYAPGFRDHSAATFVGFLPAHRYSGQEIAAIRAAEDEHPWSFGPYMLQEHAVGQRLTLVANPHFSTPARIPTVIFEYAPDRATLLNWLETDRIDVIGTLGLTIDQAPQLDELAQQGRLTPIYAPATAWEHLTFNIRGQDGESFFDDGRVRQAFAYAIDRERIIRESLYGKSEPLNVYVPPEHPSYPSEGIEPYRFDPDRARQLLDEAGWIMGDDGVRAKDGRPFVITLATTDTPVRRAVAATIVENLASVGVRVAPEFYEPNVLFGGGAEGVLSSSRFDLAMFAWVAGIAPAHELFRCDRAPTPDNGYQGQNFGGYCDSSFDAAARESLLAADESQAREADRRALLIFNRDLPLLPLYRRVLIAAHGPRVTGVRIDPTSDVDLWNLHELEIKP